MSKPHLQTQRHLSAEQVRAVTALIDAVTEADDVRPLSEHVMLHLRYGGDRDVWHVLAYDPGSSSALPSDADAGAHDHRGDLAGYAHLDATDEVAGPAAEVAVHPAHRRRGIGGRLVERLVELSPDGRLRLWAHGEHPGAAALATRYGFERARVLWQLRRSLYAPLPVVTLPDGVRLRTFVPGQDEQAWTELNNRAFAEHPDQGGWGVEEIRTREKEPWFDPAGFFLAVREPGGELLGFHWTKVHGGSTDAHEHEAIGEVYVVGVDPTAQGTGLGRALTLAGLHYLRSRDLGQAMLYVDETNPGAVRMYERLGFTHWDTDVTFARA